MTEFEEVLETILEEYARRDTEGDFDTWEETDSFVKEKAEVLLAYANLKEEPVSEDLEEKANQLAQKYFPDESNIWARANIEAKDCKNACIEMAKWQNEQMMSKAIDVEVKVDAGGCPYIPQMELYDYDKGIPLAKKEDKYKVILIKED